jgi:hypothetical protein
MNPDPIIGRVLFTDGIVRPVFLDDGPNQYVIDLDGHTRCYGSWLRPQDADADRAVSLSKFAGILLAPRRGCLVQQ